MSRPVVYVAHPLNAPTRAGIEANRAKASRWVAWAALNGCATIADWIILSGQLPETPANRALGLEIDCTLIERCDAVLHVGGRVSEGMAIEGAHARISNVAVVDLTELGAEPPQFPFDLLARVMEAINGRT